MSHKRPRKACWKEKVANQEYVRQWPDGREYSLARVSLVADRYPQVYIPLGTKKFTVPKELLGKRIEVVIRVVKL